MLWSRLMVNNKSVGSIEVQQDPDQPYPSKDTVLTYTAQVRHDGEYREAKVEHRYGDGALVLLRKALEALE